MPKASSSARALRQTHPIPSMIAALRSSMAFPWIATLTVLAVIRVLMMLYLPFSDTTEARYGEIARKMLETGDWITPQFDYGIAFWGKPPLHTWMSAFGMRGLGTSEFGARIPIFLAALAILSLVFCWIRDLANKATAFAAVTVLASSVLFFGASGFVMTDIPMTLGLTLSMVGFFRCITAADRGWGYAVFVGLAIGLLAKGPVALVLCAMSCSIWLVSTKRIHVLRHIPWRGGSVIMLLLAMPWYLLAEFKTPGFLGYFLIGEHVERFLVPDWQGDLYGSGHERAKGMIWLYALGAFLPWTLFGVLLSPRKVVAKFRADYTGLRSYLLCWVLSPLILFTPAANILAAYTLPSLPAAACLGVLLWKDTKPNSKLPLTIGGTAISFTAMLGVALLAVNFLSPLHEKWRAERTLVAAIDTHTSNAALHMWCYRSYSAEFYRRGDVAVLCDFSKIRELKKNATRDAVAVNDLHQLQLGRWLRPEFEKVGKFGRHSLYLETIDTVAQYD